MSILEKFLALSPDYQKQVEQLIDLLLIEHQQDRQTPLGISGKEFVNQFAGTIPVDIVEEIEQAINDPIYGCSNIEGNE